jgi:hypothetical protein
MQAVPNGSNALCSSPACASPVPCACPVPQPLPTARRILCKRVERLALICTRRVETNLVLAAFSRPNELPKNRNHRSTVPAVTWELCGCGCGCALLPEGWEPLYVNGRWEGSSAGCIPKAKPCGEAGPLFAMQLGGTHRGPTVHRAIHPCWRYRRCGSTRARGGRRCLRAGWKRCGGWVPISLAPYNPLHLEQPHSSFSAP